LRRINGTGRPFLPIQDNMSSPDESTLAADQILDAAEKLGTDEAATLPVDMRKARRLPYEALVALVLPGAAGERSAPIVLRAADISSGGLSVLGSEELPAGTEGVVQMVRTDRQYAIIGVRVRHCRYLGPMEHVTGLQFIPLPSGFTRHEFLDDNGRMKLLDPLLKQNAE